MGGLRDTILRSGHITDVESGGQRRESGRKNEGREGLGVYLRRRAGVKDKGDGPVGRRREETRLGLSRKGTVGTTVRQDLTNNGDGKTPGS